MLKRLALCAALIAGAAAPAACDDTSFDTVYPPEAIRADFDQLYADLRAAHFDLFAATPQAVFDQRHAEMRAGFDTPMRRFEIQRDFQTFIALARHGHARIDFPMDAFEAFRAAGGGTLPVTIRVDDGRVFVETVPAGLGPIAPGDEILALAGMPNTVWMPALTRHVSAETPQLAHTLLEFYLPGLIWLEWPEMTEASLRLRHPDGSEAVVTVPFLTREERAERAEASADPFSLEGREARMLDDQIAYLRPGPFYNDMPGENVWDASRFTAFVDDAFRSFGAAGAEALIIDLRDNPGGDNSFSDPMLAWIADRPFRFASRFTIRVSEQSTAANQTRLDSMPEGQGGASALFAELYASRDNGETVEFELPFAEPRPAAERFAGPVWVLINRYSFSNAVSAAAIVQDYGFGTLAGEPTADMSTTYGAMEQFTLARTGLAVGYPKAHIVRPNGTEVSHPVTPDLMLDTPAIRGPEDIVLEQLVSRVRADLAGGLARQDDGDGHQDDQADRGIEDAGPAGICHETLQRAAGRHPDQTAGRTEGDEGRDHDQRPLRCGVGQRHIGAGGRDRHHQGFRIDDLEERGLMNAKGPGAGLALGAVGRRQGVDRGAGELPGHPGQPERPGKLYHGERHRIALDQLAQPEDGGDEQDVEAEIHAEPVRQGAAEAEQCARRHDHEVVRPRRVGHRHHEADQAEPQCRVHGRPSLCRRAVLSVGPPAAASQYGRTQKGPALPPGPSNLHGDKP